MASVSGSSSLARAPTIEIDVISCNTPLLFSNDFHSKHSGVPNVRYDCGMAKNGPKGRGRAGTVKKRTQVLSTRNKRWTKVNARTGKFIDQMAAVGQAFKGVKKKGVHKKRR